MNKVICIGGSTGAPRVLTGLLQELPRGFPAPILAALHMTPALLNCYVMSLAGKSSFETVIAENNTVPEPGKVFISPAGNHIGLNKVGRIVVTPKPENAAFKPSIDVLFYTAAQAARGNVVAVVLSGLSAGRDAVEGAKAIKAVGGKVLVLDDPATRFLGMPKNVMDAGAATAVATLETMAKKIELEAV